MDNKKSKMNANDSELFRKKVFIALFVLVYDTNYNVGQLLILHDAAAFLQHCAYNPAAP